VGRVEGDEQAFRELYAAHGRALLAYAVRRLPRPEDAADVVAEAMLVAWRRRAEAPPGDEARLWLFGVARRVLANQRRGDRRRHRLGERLGTELGPQLAVAAADHHTTAVEAHVVVRRALEQLDEGDREVLRLHAWEGLGPHEIAAVLGIGTTTARSRLHRARARLRRHLAAAGVTHSEETA
jgi:RNA polymerase sigma factor (sigma-70 family)